MTSLASLSPLHLCSSFLPNAHHLSSRCSPSSKSQRQGLPPFDPSRPSRPFEPANRPPPAPNQATPVRRPHLDLNTIRLVLFLSLPPPFLYCILILTSSELIYILSFPSFSSNQAETVAQGLNTLPGSGSSSPDDRVPGETNDKGKKASTQDEGVGNQESDVKEK